MASAWPCASRRVFSASASAAMVILVFSTCWRTTSCAVSRCSSALACALWISASASNCATWPRCDACAACTIQLRVGLRDQRLGAVLTGDGFGFLRFDEDALLGFGASSGPAPSVRFVLRHLDLQVAIGLGLADRRQRFLLLDVDALVGLGLLLALLGLGEVLRHLDGALAHLLGLTDRTLAVLVGDVDLGLVDGFGRRLLADALDVSRLVRDVGDVHVDEIQADLVELGRHVAADRVQEFLAVLVDLLDGQRGHRQAQLAEDDLARHALDVVLRRD